MAELIWEGKYDKQGRKAQPLRIPLPFQTVETVNESAEDRRRQRTLFEQGKPTDWRNRLIWGDKKYVLPSLLEEFAGKVTLIYIDPPFATGDDFSFRVTINGEAFEKEPSLLEVKAYRDTWGRGIDSWLQWFYETVVLLYDLLADNGSLYVHLDWHVGHYAKCVLDEVFGYECFQREIIWRIGWVSGYKTAVKNWIRNHDTILFYTKHPTDFVFNKLYIPYPPNYQRRGGTLPKGEGIPIEDVWGLYHEEGLTSIQIMSFSREKTGFPTQKPEALLGRIIKASSNEGDLVLDCFVGSGTTAVVAEKLGRRWIASDISRFAIHTTRKRLLQIPNLRPFVVQNLGKYERQVWQIGEFGDGDTAEDVARRQKAYTEFILKLYGARPVHGHAWLHGVKGGRMVHVGGVDAPVTLADVTNIIAEFRKIVGTGKDSPTTNGVDILGWDFAFEINEVAKQQAAAANVDVRFLRIPRDVMDKRAVEQGDIHFFELAALSVDVRVKGRTVTVRLTNFVIPPDDVPEDVRRTVKHWSQWIDYWAVDWNFQGDTFHNEWQAFRTRQNKELPLQATHTYEHPGDYAIVIKVIDILGNDTTKVVRVSIP